MSWGVIGSGQQEGAGDTRNRVDECYRDFTPPDISPRSFEVVALKQLPHNLLTVEVCELVTMRLEESETQGFLSRTQVGRFKLEIVENVRSKLRRVHLPISQDGLGYGDDFSAFSLMHRQKTNVARISDSETPHRWKNDPYIKWFHGEYSLDDGTTLCTTVAGIYHPSYRSIPTTVRTLLEQIPAPKRQAVRGWV